MSDQPNFQDEYIVMPPQGFSGGLPTMPKGDRADLIDKIKPEKAVDLVRHRLMGEELIDSVWQKVPALSDRALSEVGAWELSNMMLATATINTSISKLDDSEIKRRLLRISKTTQYLCITNWTKYGIKNTSQLWFVHEIVFTNALVVLKQADGASIQELLKGTVTENRNIMSGEQQNKGKIRRFLGL